MQQTNKYKFNLIDTSDAFGPEPLNDNANKLETALDQHEAAVSAALASQKAETDSALSRHDATLSTQAAQIVQAREENCLVKLAGPIGSNSRVELTGVDLSKYRGFLIVAYATDGTGYLSVGEYLTVKMIGMGMHHTWCFMEGNHCVAVTNAVKIYTTSLQTTVSFTEEWPYNNVFATTSGIQSTTLYGIKA